MMVVIDGVEQSPLAGREARGGWGSLLLLIGAGIGIRDEYHIACVIGFRYGLETAWGRAWSVKCRPMPALKKDWPSVAVCLLS